MDTVQPPPETKRKKSPPIDPARLPSRLPPFSEEGERGVMGCLLINAREAHIPLVEKFTDGSEVFYDLRHRAIYDTVLGLLDAGKPADILTVTQAIKDCGKLDDVGVAYLSSLPDCVPSASNINYYADIVAEKYMLRKMVNVCSSTIGKVYEYEGKVDELVDSFEEDALSIRRMGAIGEVNVKEALQRGIDHMEMAHNNPGKMWGVESGFIDLDRMTRGFRGGNMFTIAARPSVGKTSLAMNIAEHAVLNLRIPVGIFSLEMSGEELLFRATCSRARVSSEVAMDGKMTLGDFKKMTAAQSAWRNAPIHIVDRGGLSIAQIRAHARRMVQRYGIKLFVVDYLQLISATIGRNENRTTEVTRISNGIKSMAKEFDVPVVVLSQLNREMEKFKRAPQLSDLRESGALEQDSDGVLLLHRKNEDTENPVWTIHANLAKQRNGKTGQFDLTLFREITRFENASRVAAGPQARPGSNTIEYNLG